MEPSNFDGSNAIYGPPRGMSESEVRSIFAYHGPVYDWPGTNNTVVCWKPRQDEIDEIQRTGQVWIVMMGGLAPHFVTGHKPTMKT